MLENIGVTIVVLIVALISWRFAPWWTEWLTRLLNLRPEPQEGGANETVLNDWEAGQTRVARGSVVVMAIIVIIFEWML